jgi:hypothetical protein
MALLQMHAPKMPDSLVYMAYSDEDKRSSPFPFDLIVEAMPNNA